MKPKLVHNVILLLLMPFFSIWSQEYQLSGKIVDEEHNPLVGVNIIIYAMGLEHDMITYGITNTEGIYALAVKNQKEIKIEVSYLGFKTMRKTIKLNMEDNTKNLVSDFQMIADLVALETVSIVAQKYQDTVKIKTDKLKLSKDSSLRDILNKSDGFQVSKNGHIAFNGIPITKILINKKEVFINQNSIALDNLNFELMNNIEVINNYKDRFDIDFSNFTEPVINIDTKKEFKGVFKFLAEGGYGYKNSFVLKGKAMYFSDNFNAFITQNTNNIFERDFQFDNISSSFKENTTSFFKSNVSSFLENEERLKKDLANNTSITVRKEGKDYKTGAVIYYNYSDQIKNEIEKTKSLEKQLRTEQYTFSNLGNLGFINFYWNHKLLKNTSLRYEFNGGSIHRRLGNTVERQIFDSEIIFLNERNDRKTASEVVTNEINLRSLLSSNMLLYARVNFFSEKSNTNFELYADDPLNIADQNGTQDIENSNTYLTSELGFDYKFSNAFTSGIGLDYVESSENIADQLILEANRRSEIKRKIKEYKLEFLTRGQTKRIDYFVNVSPTIKKLVQRDTNFVTIPVSASLAYKITPNKNLSLSYTNAYNLIELNETVDTLLNSYTTRTITDTDFSMLLNRNHNLNLSYHYSNIAKSKFLLSSITYNMDKDYLQTVFDRVSNTILFYKKRVFDRREQADLSFSTGKGFYFSEAYHKISIALKSRYSLSKAPTWLQEKIANFEDETSLLGIAVSFEPQGYFFEEISINSSWINNNSFFDNVFFFKQDVLRNTVAISSKTKKFEYTANFYWDYFNTSVTTYQKRDLDFDLKYTLSDKTSLFLKSKSTLTLFDIVPNTISSLNTQTNGELRTELINNNLAGYVLLGIKYKF